MSTEDNKHRCQVQLAFIYKSFTGHLGLFCDEASLSSRKSSRSRLFKVAVM